MTTGEKIKALRKKRSMSQDQLATRCGISQSAISAIELGTNSPTIGTLQIIAEGLRIPISELTGDIEKEKPAASESDRIKDDIIIALNNLRKEDLYHLHEFAEFLVSRDKK